MTARFAGRTQSHTDCSDDANDVKRGSLILFVITSCLFFPVIFISFMSEPLRNFVFSFGCVLSILYLLIYKKCFDLTGVSYGYIWLIWLLVVIGARFLSDAEVGFSQISLLLAALVACIAASGTQWMKPALTCILILLCVHLLATIIFFIAPSLYLMTIKEWFNQNVTTAIGYQSGLSPHYSDNGFLMAMGVLLSASYFFVAREPKYRRRYGVLVILFAFGLVLTQKRAHLVFAVFSLLCTYMVSSSRGKALKTVFACVIVSAACLVAASFIPGIADSFDRLFGTFSTLESGDIEDTTSGRTLLWNGALQGWFRNPIFGNGWGSYSFTWPDGSQSIYAHNELLQILHDTGLVGLVIFAALLVATLRISLKNLRLIQRRTNTRESILTAAYYSFSLALFLCIYSCSTGTLLQQPLIFLFWFLAVGINLSIQYKILIRNHYRGTTEISLERISHD